MTRTLVANAIAALSALLLFAAPVAALPEPSMVLTLASGSALLGLIGRRRYGR